MAHKKNLLLHELLQQDQEPFHLHDYIAGRRDQLRSPRSDLQLQFTHKGRKPLSETTNSSNTSVLYFPVTFCKNACFSSNNHRSPDLGSVSPFVKFPKSPIKSNNNSNSIFLHIPSKTAALLLDAALRIHKHSSSKNRRAHHRLADLAFFGSVLKKLKHKTQKPPNQCVETNMKQSAKQSVFRRFPSRKSVSESAKVRLDLTDLDEILSDSDVYNFCSGRRRSETIWSSEDHKSPETETTCSSRNSDATRDKMGSSSPDFSFHPPSPSRRTVKDEDEEEKEQCSPVCVLDPLFEDEGHEEEDDHDGYDVECSYASVQRKKQQLLHKLRRFEKLADLDPKELEQMILEDEQCNDFGLEVLEEEDENQDTASEFSSEFEDDEFLLQVLCTLGFNDPHTVSRDMKQLVADLVAEQAVKQDVLVSKNVIMDTVCAKLGSWNEVKPNTIDMMVERDFKDDLLRWKSNQEQVTTIAMEIETAIIGSLVRELCHPLDC